MHNVVLVTVGDRGTDSPGDCPQYVLLDAEVIYYRFPKTSDEGKGGLAPIHCAEWTARALGLGDDDYKHMWVSPLQFGEDRDRDPTEENIHYDQIQSLVKVRFGPGGCHEALANPAPAKKRRGARRATQEAQASQV